MKQLMGFILALALLIIGFSGIRSKSRSEGVLTRGMLNCGAFVLSLSLFSIWLRLLEPLLIPTIVLGSGFLIYFYVLHRS
ncbi:hypothetical protein J2Y55_005836 [Bosea sp. BE125]|nr:hypothetical protein [Bosea sp. BE125]